MKIRIAIWLGEVILASIAGYALYLGQTEIASGCVVGIVALLPKLVQAEKNDV